ncbi:Voltage-dependent anion channel [Saccharopolyspora antimicrobica]|uniref:Voltage-dependent anion channel n=1 Tax=Saccharopolyspora antimicrobica TaxID=455193 RepID=A0A1I5GM32_9PSEU|nr:tellurite resistance/C4-dicarboxylate transporter family protein [Saccharopolyspora antimicrobica]RKT87471.1 voltage-gated anion channel [Saccharopolyspora antimicrobica]SFO36970.1 Voltage-dependent anion channel [Saccharopolyspora antimicrobica]
MFIAVAHRVPCESGAVVMGIGIVSVAAQLAGDTVLSWVLLTVAGVVWVLLGVSFLTRLASDAPAWRAEAVRPGALTGVAATGVLGVGLAQHGWPAVSWVFLAVAVVLWAALLPRVLRNLSSPAVGSSFLLCVATQSLAVLAAKLAVGAGWMLSLAVVADVLGLGLYAFVLSRFDFRQLVRGSGDHWIAGGALAISTVATTALASALPAGAAGAVGAGAVVLWAITSAWYVVLAGLELFAPRLRYDFRRWATVFPLGMTCTATFGVAAATGAGWLMTAAQVLLWPALVVLCLAAWGTARRVTGGLLRLARSARPARR